MRSSAPIRLDAPSMGALGPDPDEDADWSAELADFDPAEFAEFLEADDASPVPVDPGFRERLRNQLWGMVREHADAVRPRGVGTDGRPRSPIRQIRSCGADDAR